VLVSDPFVRETMDMFGQITLGIVGIGAMEPSTLLARSGNIFTSREIAAIKEAGGVGDMSLRFFDAEGRIVKTPLDDRVIGMPLEELRNVDRVLALAGGQAKTEAIRGALRTGVIDILITDKFTAARLAGQVAAVS
jgi:DNA-binding transcriptional regulator LsrR (DeoR family)